MLINSLIEDMISIQMWDEEQMQKFTFFRTATS